MLYHSPALRPSPPVNRSLPRNFGTAPPKDSHLLGSDVMPLGKAGLFLVRGHRVIPVLVEPRPARHNNRASRVAAGRGKATTMTCRVATGACYEYSRARSDTAERWARMPTKTRAGKTRHATGT